MPSHLEVWQFGGIRLVVLDADHTTVGSAPSNDVVVDCDRSVSRLHAVFERYEPGWCLRDLGSSNGTFVNGERLLGERVLHAGDEIRVGRTRLVYRGDPVAPKVTETAASEPPPALTRRERDVLVALCRPLLSGDVFTEPASVAHIAGELYVSEAAVKQHLSRLYEKFGLREQRQHRRVELANQALHRGAVVLADLRPPSGPG
ncbi:MAG: FHA domain-containing protein [Acidimicrobiales bacterium]